MTARSSSTYCDALDGLRALAVVLVLLFHWSFLDPGSWYFRGGFVGVDIFFVLSGFLITSILVREYDTHGNIAFRAFLIRRALRLFPALLVFVVGTLLIGGHSSGNSFGWTRDVRDSVLAVLYVANFGRWYDEGGTGPFMHMWSLSLEEQFYFVWPPLLGWVLRRSRDRDSAARIVLLACCAIASWRAFLCWSGASPHRIHCMLDTRADEILLGAAMALRMTSPAYRPPASRLISVPEAIAITVILAFVVIARPYALWMNVVGYPAVALATVILIRSCVTGTGRLLHSGLVFAPVAWLGRISYGFYLWHLAAVSLAASWASGRRGALVAIAIALLAASVSFNLVERPFLQWKKRFTRVTV